MDAAIFSRRDALNAGRSPAEIRRLLRRGQWERLARGSYRTADQVPPALAARAAAAAQAVPGSVVSHGTATRLYGAELLEVPRVEIELTVARRTGAWVSTAHVRAAGLPPAHVQRLDGLPVTTPARTLVDIGRTLSWRSAVVAADSLLRSTGVEAGALAAVLRDCARWPGIRRAARVVAFADGAAESPFESLARVYVVERGLPLPELQQWIGRDRVDMLWRKQRVILELDGLRKYRDDPEALVREKLRQERLEAAGWTVVRVTWNQLVRHPRETERRLRRALGLPSR